MEFFRNRWWVVFASVCGLLVGSGAINVFAFGVFLKPVTQDLHVGREFFSSGLILNSTLSALSTLPLGWMLDRWGVRRVMVVGLIFYSLGVAAYSFMTAAPLMMYLAFGLAGLFGCIGSPVPYGAAITMWFDRQRGLAIGIAMAGVGLGVAVVPQIAAFYIGHFGWRTAYLVLAATVFAIAWLPVALFVREPTHKDAAKHVDIAPQDAELPGMTPRQAFLGSWRFWTPHHRVLHRHHGDQRHAHAYRGAAHRPRHPARGRDRRALGGGARAHCGSDRLGLVHRPVLCALCRDLLFHRADDRHRAFGERRGRRGAAHGRDPVRHRRRRRG